MMQKRGVICDGPDPQPDGSEFVLKSQLYGWLCDYKLGLPGVNVWMLYIGVIASHPWYASFGSK